VPRQLGTNPKFNRMMDDLDDVPTESLDVIGGNFLHLLQAFQRLVLPEVGIISGKLKFFQNYGQEEMYAENICNTLLASGKLNREIVMSWISWFAVYKAKGLDEKGVLKGSVGLKLLFKTWTEFCTMSEGAAWTNITSRDDFPEEGGIYPRMEKFRAKATPDRWFEECIMRFGFVMTYWFLSTKTDRGIAMATVRHYIDDVQNHIRTNEDKRSRFLKAMYQTLIRRPKNFYAAPFNHMWDFLSVKYGEYSVALMKRVRETAPIGPDDPDTAVFWSIVAGKLNLNAETANENNLRTQG